VTTKADFSPEEWETVSSGPPTAGFLVVMASRGGTFRETLAVAKAYTEARSQHGASELLDELISAKPKVEHTRFHSYAELKEHAHGVLQQAMTVLAAKATAQEIEDYGAFVLTLAKKVAEAHSEHGQAVSPEEEAALADIKGALVTPGQGASPAVPPATPPSE
jgi:hypothetical protein